jgi:VanZ family protein
MQTPIATTTAPRRLHWADILAIAYVLAVGYASLIPFDFGTNVATETSATRLGLPTVHSGLPDAFANIALYLPIGLLLCSLIERRGLSRWTATVTTLGIAIALSFTIEQIQSTSLARIASFSDFAYNAIGTLLGIAFHFPAHSVARRIGPQLQRDVATNRTSVAAAAWTMVIAITALAPMDFTLDLSLLARSVRESHTVPFSKIHDLTQQTTHAATATLQSFARVDLWQLRLDYAADTFLFFGLAVLFAINLRDRHRPVRETLIMSAFASCLYALLITVGELLVVSVNMDTTRILTRSIGGITGAMTYPWLASRLLKTGSARKNAITLAALALVMSVAYTLARQLAPFNFQLSQIVAGLKSIEWIPMESYTLAKLPTALLDMLHKSFRCAWIALLIVTIQSLRNHNGQNSHSHNYRDSNRDDYRASGAITTETRIHSATTGIIAFVVAVMLTEFAQCILPGRYPSVTDILIAVAGSFIGLRIGVAMSKSFIPRQAKRQSTLSTAFNINIPPPRDDPPPASQRKRKRRRRTTQT